MRRPSRQTAFAAGVFALGVALGSSGPSGRDRVFPFRPLRIEERPSPNFGARRPAGAPVRFVVLHYTASKTLDEALGTLCNPASEVSAHYVVDRDGSVFRLVPESARAWHAGVGSWRGAQDVNSVSIGVEIVNPGPPEPFPEPQIRSVVSLCHELAERHPGVEFVGHSDVAPGRKADPGPLFPWRRLAASGIGFWTDDLAEPSLDAAEMLRDVGYGSDVPPETALRAFRLRWAPDTLDPDDRGRALRRLAAVHAALARRPSVPQPDDRP